ncbi:Pseudouridine synthase [uncultured spirochete]|uniref:Pseudouridine synthase n=1 Tax=uncultured spirochete TaxID=156406 RepID=A0A3P3XTE6_9SPIR|nr:Pseudouridine synthase [uncultured spirochete]
MKANKKRNASPESPAGISATSSHSFWEGVASPPEPMRADRYLSEILKLMTRSQLKARNARLFCNGKEVKLSHKLKHDDSLSLEWTEEPPEEIVPEPVPLKILYQDDGVFVIDKPQGMVTHPAAGNWHGTLANGVLWLSGGSRPVSESQELLVPPHPPRAGIVHRLDKDTSGVIIVARTASAHEFLSRQFRDRQVRKEYFAIVRGRPPASEGRIDTWLARSPRDRKKFAVSQPGRGKHALTLYKIRAVWNLSAANANGSPSAAASGPGARHRASGSKASAKSATYSLLALYPKTGRTHQLRVHCAHIGCPILGDPIYSKKDTLFPDATLMLHARRLKIRLPSRSEPSVFKAPVPKRFRDMITLLNTGI